MNKKKEKLERLLKMQEHPENYTEEEIRQLMADDECRQLYEQMVHAADAIFANKEEYELNDKEVTSIHPAVKTEYRFKNIAAILIGVLMLSGIAYAAFHYVYMNRTCPDTDGNKFDESRANGGGHPTRQFHNRKADGFQEHTSERHRSGNSQLPSTFCRREQP